MNILIANESSLVAEGISMIVKSSYRQAKIATTNSANNLVKMLNRHATYRWNVILIDDNLSRLVNLNRLHKLSPDTKVCLFSSQIRSRQDAEHFREGFSGLLPTSATPVEAGRAMNLLLSGQKSPQKEIDHDAQKPVSNPQKGSNKNAITYRQQEILSLMALGLSNKEIASHHNLSESTIKRHLSNIFKRLGVHNRVEAAREASELGLLLN